MKIAKTIQLDVRGKIKSQTSYTRHAAVIATLVMMLLTWGCSFITDDPKPRIELLEPTLCKGWIGDTPLTLHDVISPDETKICLCGHLQFLTGREAFLQVKWYGEGYSLSRRLSKFKEGQFRSCVIRGEGFEPGDYLVNVYGGKTRLAQIEFTVEAGQAR